MKKHHVTVEEMVRSAVEYMQKQNMRRLPKKSAAILSRRLAVVQKAVEVKASTLSEEQRDEYRRWWQCFNLWRKALAA